MRKSLISVIIPVYNLEQYICKCIDSVLNQTYSNFEIIAVDDGSTDNTAEILKEYANKDSRVKPVFKENGGVSSTRNLGIDVATGEYIYFLDGDDWIEPDTFEKLLEFSKVFDVVQGAHINSYDDGTAECSVDFITKDIVDKEGMLEYYFTNKIQESCWNKLYKKSVIGNIRFDEKLAVSEDSKFIYEIIENASKIKLISDITYHYYIRKDSCAHAVLEEKHFSTLYLRENQYEEIKNNKKLLKKFVCKYSWDIFHLINRILQDETKRYDKQLPVLRGKILKEKWYIFISSNISVKFKIGVLVLWLAPELFYKIFKKIHSKDV